MPIRTRMGTLLGAALLLAGCGQQAPDETSQARLDDLEARFTPGLHTMMVDLAARHASLWFAGDGENWALADYQAHELEEVAEDIRTLHPEYDEIPVASLMAEMAMPAIEEVGVAIDASDREAFVAAYDRLTTSCNACHGVSDRSAIVIQRPSSPPLTNLRYAP